MSGAGVRTSVGPRAARVHVGAGRTTVSSGFGPFSASSGGSRPRRSSARSSSGGGDTDVVVAAGAILLALSVASMMADGACARREQKKLLKQSTLAAEQLTSVHREDFPHEVEPEARDVERSWRNLWLVDDYERAEHESEQQSTRQRWDRLRMHDPDTVIETVDAALGDNVSLSACVDAGIVGGHPYVTLAVHYPGPEITEGLVQAEGIVRERNKSERAALYKEALASTVIATVKEAFASAPAATYAKVAVFSAPSSNFFTRRRRKGSLTAIYAATFQRDVLSVDWGRHNALQAALEAEDLRFNTDRGGKIKPIGKLAGDDIARLAVHLEDAAAEQV